MNLPQKPEVISKAAQTIEKSLPNESGRISYAKKAITGGVWMLTSSSGLQILTLIVTTVLARLLIPSDFGSFVLVAGITGILQTFAEMGTSVAIIQRKTAEPQLIDSAFMTTIIITCLVVVLLWVTSNGIARFFSIPVVSPLLKIASIAYFFRGIFSLYRCLLLRDLRFKELSIMDFSGYMIYGSTAIILANYGYGPFSMVWAQGVWSLCLILMGLWRTRYVPRGWGSAAEAWSLLTFGFWVSIGRVMRNGAGQVDNFVIGKVLNATLLGSYHMAQSVVMVIPLAYTRVIDQIMLPIYSKWQDDLQRVEEGYWKAIFYSSVVLVPLIFLLFLFAESIIVIALGEKWIGIAPLIRIMSLFGLSRSLGDGIFDSLVYSLGRPKIVTAMNSFRVIALPAFVIVGSIWGIQGVAWGFAAYGVAGRFFGQGLLKKAFNFSVVRYLKEIALAIFSAAAATVLCIILADVFLVYGKLSENVANALTFLTWIIIYGCLILVFARAKCAYIFSIFFQNKRESGAPAA